MAEPQHRARIRACWSFIVSHLRAQDIADYLFEHSVLSSEQVQCVTYEGITDEERTRRLLRILLSKDNRTFNVFIESLKESYDFLAEEILQKELPEPNIDDESSDDEDSSVSNKDNASQHCDAYILCCEADYDKVMKFKDRIANDIIFGDGSRAKVFMRGDLFWTNSVFDELDEVLNKKYNIFIWNSPAFRKEARAQAFLEEFMCALTQKEDKRQRVLVLRTVQGDKKHPKAAKALQSVDVCGTILSMLDPVDIPDAGFVDGGPSMAEVDARAYNIIQKRILYARNKTHTHDLSADNTEDDVLYSEEGSCIPVPESIQPLNKHPPPPPTHV